MVNLFPNERILLKIKSTKLLIYRWFGFQLIYSVEIIGTDKRIIAILNKKYGNMQLNFYYNKNEFKKYSNINFKEKRYFKGDKSPDFLIQNYSSGQSTFFGNFFKLFLKRIFNFKVKMYTIKTKELEKITKKFFNSRAS